MNTERKWMVTLDEGTYEWVKRTAEELKIHGSDIIKELIKQVMNDDPSEFKNTLLEARERLLREELEEKKEAIEAQLRALRANVAQTATRKAKRL